jgi:hemolysin activation/secretion protein
MGWSVWAFFGALACASIAVAQTTQESAAVLSEQLTLRVQRFAFDGNVMLGDEALTEAIGRALPNWRERELAMEDLETARQAVTRAYIDRGYINSGAVIPDQTIEDGVVVLQVVEGRLSEVRITGRQRLREAYLARRAWNRGDAPLNIITLRDRLELLRQDPNVARINAELSPGLEPGQSVLTIDVEERSVWQLGLHADNRGTPSVGAERLEVLAANRNLTGNGDALSLRYGIIKGGVEDIEFAGLDDFGVAYALPLNSYGTSLIASFVRSDSLIVEEPFVDLDIESQSNTVDLTLRQAIRQTPDGELALFLTASYADNETELEGVPFSFSPGAEDGRSAVTAIRFGQEWFARDQRQALALRSTFSLGVDAFGSTINGDDVPDSQFFAWTGQAQYVRRLNEDDWRLVMRGAVQLSADPLLSLEQIAIGGFDTVRGYRENALVRDNGAAASAELRIPLWRKGDRAVLTVAPFFDIGYGWNDGDSPDYPLLYSAGAGIIYSPSDRLTAQVYWGYAFNELDDESDDLQDLGIHFDVMWWLAD